MKSGDNVLHNGKVRTIHSIYSETMVSLCLVDKDNYEYKDVEEDYQTPTNKLIKLT